MKKNTYWLCILAIFCFGCSENNSEECTESVCLNETSLNACVDGKYQENPCEFGCKDGICLSIQAVCTNGETKCESNTEYLCSNQTWNKQKDCEYGCDENGCKSAPSGETCTNGETKCESNVKYKCNNSVWIKASDCPYGCNENVCNDFDINEVCTNDDVICGNNAEYICKSNKWEKLKNCEFGCYKQESCNICELNETKCAEDPQEILICRGNTWGHYDFCELECIDGKCRNCEDGEKKCDGDLLKTCVNADWSDGEVCEMGCYKNTCRDVDNRDSCNWLHEKSFCIGDLLYRCDNYTNGSWVVEKCSNGKKCISDYSGNYDCYELCSENEYNNTKNICVVPDILEASSERTEMLYNYKCRKNQNNEYYWNEEEFYYCHGECSDGKCVKHDEAEAQSCSSSKDNYCSGSNVMKCEYNDYYSAYNNTWNAYPCTFGTNENFVCYSGYESIDNGIYKGKYGLYCAEPCSQEESGNTKLGCGGIKYTIESQRVYTFTCSKNESDNNYYWIRSTFTTDYCSHTCENGKCTTIHEKEGLECNPDIDEDYCDGTIKLSCSSSKKSWYATDCSKNEDQLCGKDKFGAVSCMYQCFNEGRKRDKCQGVYYYKNPDECIKQENGSLTWMTYNESGTYCSNGCDENGCI